MTVSNVFMSSLGRTRAFRGKTLPQPAQKKLKDLEHKDLLLSPHGGPSGFQLFGIDKPDFFSTLNVGGIRIRSKTAREQPRQLAKFLSGLAEAQTLQTLYEQIIEGAKGGLIGIREGEIRDKQTTLNTDMQRLAAERGQGFGVKTHSLQAYDQSTGFSEREYLLETTEAVTGRITEFKVQTRYTAMDGEQASAIATLPWNSPDLVGRLNQLFGMPWFYKRSLRYFTQHTNCREIQYAWATFRASTQAPLQETSKWQIVDIDLVSPDAVVRGIVLDFQEIDQFARQHDMENLRHPQLKEAVLAHLEDQLAISLSRSAADPFLSRVIPDLAWDLGVVRAL